jgi:anaphase-promoting complex subunit 1
MASVRSLGLHRPSGLQAAIDELLLPPDAACSTYKWDITSDGTGDGEVEDELLTTKDCVIWSRGGVFQKSFKYELEKEPINKAILANFPSSDEETTMSREGKPTCPLKDPPLAKALVVFLKTQAHIHFLSGTSYVVHMPFEVESVCAAPRGIIIQRKQRADNIAPVSLKFPRVPPNSFVSSQMTAVSRSSQQNVFSVEGLGKPKALPLRLSSTLENMWEPQLEQSDSHWPRLVCLTDPLLELGLVVSQPEHNAKDHDRRTSRKSPYFLDPAEEILHVEEIRRAGTPVASEEPLALAVTINREAGNYSIWRLSYIKNEDPFIGQLKKPKIKNDRRRSSMQPGYLSGTATPVQPSFRESFGATLPGKRQRKSEKTEKPIDDFVSSLDPEKEKESGVTRRTSRRVSSMLARADLSVSQDRSVFSEQPLMHNHGGSKREASHGSFQGRTSGGGRGSLSHAQTIHPSLGSLLEAPFDSVLDEGFHNMGLDDHDFDGLTQEIRLTKVYSIPLDSSNIRYSLSSKPATGQCKVFILVAPSFATDSQHRSQVLVCIQDPVEKRLQLLTISVERLLSPDQHLQPGFKSPGSGAEAVVLKAGQLIRVQSVVDSGMIVDGGLSAVLILSESMDGRRELSLQAPWSPLTNLRLPLLVIDDVRSLQYRGRAVDRDVSQMAVETIDMASGNMSAIRHTRRRGLVDIVDGGTRLHQLNVQLRPSSPQVCKVLDACRSVLPTSVAEKMFAAWWHAMQWLNTEHLHVADREWSSLVILLLAMFLAIGRTTKPTSTTMPPPQRKRRGPSGSIGSVKDLDDWRSMMRFETANSAACPRWMLNRGWQWVMDEDVEADDGQVESAITETKFMSVHIQHAKNYMASRLGEIALGSAGYLPTAMGKSAENRRNAACQIFMALHLLLEEQKLDVMCSEYSPSGKADLRVLACQLARWLRWHTFVSTYELGIQEYLDPRNDSGVYNCSTVKLHANTCAELELKPEVCEPVGRFSIYDWIQANLVGGVKEPFTTLADIHYAGSVISEAEKLKDTRWDSITPRTLMFKRFFRSVGPKNTASEFVETMYKCGIDGKVMETLPEAILAPIQDAICTCQPQPPTAWSKELLELVGRSDISLALTPGQHQRHPASHILTPSHNASWDFRTLCQSVDEYNNVGYDEGNGTERQAVIRALFKDDRRLNEAQDLLSTHRARVVRLDPQPKWTESEYLERQKELVSRIATGTLAIPAGRALLYYSLRFPLLTQRFQIGGFNLNCTVRPTNVTVGVDKTQFTEEKVCWGFFHQGVAAGLVISPHSKGIDTSWILYNKPGHDLSNRHAGFLLGLGLNGHLKDVAKWVAFKYLTPKHTMTSIGLLLGLAASYLGTMDSLITRLLSVHVTRMLPRGAAELNLSPLTQTTGIMGIGLLYCRSQHRRMSEIMLSEIIHDEEEDEEEPLRSECYRLAAGLALGFINLGKGTDLRGLHDMKLTEELIAVATSTKKVEAVHVLDRAAAGAVMAIALIFMKSEDPIVARKIDVPSSILQFDYVRPDILLLRTVAKNLILWREIDPSFAWISSSLPKAYRVRHKLVYTEHLSSVDLPFFSILAGICFSVALRFAGSASTKVRDLLVHYLDEFIRITRIPASVRSNPDEAAMYDEELARSNARTCQDVLAISAAMVMAGTGDLVVLRRLRALHGRDDPDTPYGSHLATHLAIGALFLGCGTTTFGTSDLAIASLLVAFYPIFPTSVMDNRSHLQAFRHFWVLATDPRCLVAKDVTSGQPISVPVHIKMRSQHPLSSSNDDEGEPEVLVRITPCLLPPLPELASVRTDAGSAFWDIEVDFTKPEVVSAFRNNQSIFLRRRPAQEAPFTATLRALGRDALAEIGPSTNAASSTGVRGDPLEWVFDQPALSGLTQAERALVLDRSDTADESSSSMVDARLVLEGDVDGTSRDALLGLRLLFEWAEKRGEGSRWLRDSVIESLKGRVWAGGS